MHKTSKVSQEDYKQKIAAKSDKKKPLPWESKEIADKNYRILFRRDAGSDSDSAPDTAFYFNNKDDVIIPSSYTFMLTLYSGKRLETTSDSLKILEVDQSGTEKPHLILEKLNFAFKESMAVKVTYRSLIEHYKIV